MKRIIIMSLLLLYASILFGCDDEPALPTETSSAETTSYLQTEEFTVPDEPKLISLSFENVDPIRVTVKGTYPRLYKLADGTLLCGIDGYCFRSEDEGLTWSSGYDYRRNYAVRNSEGVFQLTCANTAFYQLSDGTLLAAYRATGYIDKAKSVFCTKILVSQSTDGGKRWNAHSTICEYYDYNGKTRGVWEPHFGMIDGVLTCFYANDSFDVVEKYQNIEYLQWINGEWTNRTIVSNGDDHSSRDGMPVWQRLSSGKYICAIEGWVPGGTALCIKLLWSDDGVNWSKPTIVYRAKNGTCGAPYVVELPTGQLYITFQTNENFNGSVPLDEPKMYGIISDGTPVESIKAKNFSKPENVFGLADGEYGKWNSIYLSDNYLYIATHTNHSALSGTLIKRISLEELISK